MQQPVGKDMAPRVICAKLDFIHRQKIASQPLWHRLDSADPVGGTRRHDAFFASDECNHAGPPRLDDAVIHLARKQPQRQADDPRAVPQHPLDRIVSLAGVCRPQNGRHAGWLHIGPRRNGTDLTGSRRPFRQSDGRQRPAHLPRWAQSLGFAHRPQARLAAGPVLPK